MQREYIHCRRVVGAVTRVQRLHLGHEVEEEAPHPLLTLWKPEEKMKGRDVEHFARLRNRCLQRRSPLSATGLQYSRSNTRCPRSYWGAVLQCVEGHLPRALFQRLDQHLLEGADLLQVSQNQGHIRAAESGTHTHTGREGPHALVHFSNSAQRAFNVWSESMRTCRRFEELAGNLTAGSEDPWSILSRFPEYSATPGAIMEKAKSVKGGGFK